MTITDDIDRSRRLVMKWWPTVSELCPDRRLHASHLEPVEGMQAHRSEDLDRKYHIDHFAVVKGSMWTPVSTRFQAIEFSSRRTVTFRESEIKHMRSMVDAPDLLGAALHVQMYGDIDRLEYVLVADVSAVMTYYRALGFVWWLNAPDGHRFNAITRGALLALEGFVWDCRPGQSQQLELFA